MFCSVEKFEKGHKFLVVTHCSCCQYCRNWVWLEKLDRHTRASNIGAK